MKKQSENAEPLQSEANASTPKKEKTLSQILKEKGYDNSRVGQAFVMSWQPPKKEKKAS